MLKLKLMGLAVLVATLLPFTASATPKPLPPIPISSFDNLNYFGATDFANGPNDPTTNLNVLASFLGLNSGNLTLCSNFEDLDGVSPTGTFEGGEFLIVHYGKGQGGLGAGGSWEFYQVIADGAVDLPNLGNTALNPDIFGHGGISSVRGFCPPSVPDGGATVMLLGLALTGFGVVRRWLI